MHLSFNERNLTHAVVEVVARAAVLHGDRSPDARVEQWVLDPLAVRSWLVERAQEIHAAGLAGFVDAALVPKLGVAFDSNEAVFWKAL